MKKFLTTLLLLFAVMTLQAQSISHIETTRSWYYIYDQNGKKTKTLSTNIGELQGFSASFFIVKSSAWYYIYDAKGNKTKTLSTSSVGEVLSVAGDTFTSRLGSWVYTWSKDGKKISTRPANH
jgi:hypothetical protein